MKRRGSVGTVFPPGNAPHKSLGLKCLEGHGGKKKHLGDLHVALLENLTAIFVYRSFQDFVGSLATPSVFSSVLGNEQTAGRPPDSSASTFFLT